ncbi:MAG: hypothetical protein KDB87_19600 [Flavobacteriales bacterium]|nr:hypothetical protein [Flavobacteriales bacterium]
MAELGERVRSGLAAPAERDEYMTLLYQNGSITPQQYRDYQSGRNADAIVNAALAVGAVLLIGYLIKAAFSD